MAALSDRDLLYKRRMLLENPYAHTESLEQEGGASLDARAATMAEVAASRRLLENPYAHLGEAGAFEALASKGTEHDATANSQPARHSPHAWSDQEIEAKAAELHRLLWRRRKEIWAEGVPQDPVDLLDPAVALHVLGYDFQYVEGLGQMRGTAGLIEVGGLIDNSAKLVRVARQFAPAVRSYTGAHELGHAVLHQHLAVLHQDKPCDGISMPRDRVEVEANKFAKLFLMPAKLVAARFTELFLVTRFEVTEESAFALVGRSSPELLRLAPTRRDLAKLLASAERFNGRYFVPLHAQFRVSREAMAIRLEELSLVPR